MSNTEETRYRLGDHVLKTGPGYAQYGPHAQDGDFIDLSRDELGELSEFIAFAWQNVANAPYEPKHVGVPIEDREFDAITRLERDCE